MKNIKSEGPSAASLSYPPQHLRPRDNKLTRVNRIPRTAASLWSLADHARVWRFTFEASIHLEPGRTVACLLHNAEIPPDCKQPVIRITSAPVCRTGSLARKRNKKGEEKSFLTFPSAARRLSAGSLSRVDIFPTKNRERSFSFGRWETRLDWEERRKKEKKRKISFRLSNLLHDGSSRDEHIQGEKKKGRRKM